MDVSTAVSALSDEFRARPEVPWTAIGGMRDRVAHTYRQISRAALWQVIATDIPALIAPVGGG